MVATYKNDDGGVSVVIPNGETYKSGEIRAAADGRLGRISVDGGSAVGDGAITCSVLCAVDEEYAITTTVAVVAGAGGAGFDVATQSLVPAGAGDKDVRLVLHDAAAGTQARVVLN